MKRIHTVASLFRDKSHLSLTGVASTLGINRSLLAQYASGIKQPSLERLREIEEGLHELGRELMLIKLIK